MSYDNWTSESLFQGYTVPGGKHATYLLYTFEFALKRSWHDLVHIGIDAQDVHVVDSLSVRQQYTLF